MPGPFDAAKEAARAALAAEGERAAFGLAAALAAAASLGFASLALWIALARGLGALGASLILAALLAGLAGGLLALGRARARRRRLRAAAAKARLERDALTAALTTAGAARIAPLAALAIGMLLGARRR